MTATVRGSKFGNFDKGENDRGGKGVDTGIKTLVEKQGQH